MSDAPADREVRVVLEVADVGAFASILKDVLGLDELARFGEQGQEAVLLDGGRATIELGNRAHIEHIDSLETGQNTTRTFRIALSVDDAERATSELSDSEQLDVVAAPRPMPWGSVNARLETSLGVQVTVFEQREPETF